MISFEETWKIAEVLTALGRPRADNLYHVTRMADKIDGDFAECGVWRGGSAYVVLSAMDKNIHLYDSFDGMPEPTEEDAWTDKITEQILKRCSKKGQQLRRGAFRYPMEMVEKNLSDYDGRYTLHKGFFIDTLHKSVDTKYAMVHLDVDFYQSYKQCLEYFVPRIVPGGYMVFDEYKFKLLPGARQAIDEYFGDIESMHHWHANIQLTIRL